MLSTEAIDVIERALARERRNIEMSVLSKDHETREFAAIDAALAELAALRQGGQVDVPQYYSLPPSELVQLRNTHILYFYHRVCRLAEKNMASTGTVSGAHWNAMHQVLAQMNIPMEATNG